MTRRLDGRIAAVLCFVLTLAVADAARAQGEAEKILQMVMRAAPNHARGLHEYGLLKFKQGQGEEALDLLRRAATLAPEEVLYHANLGVAFQRLDRLYEAEAAYRRALELKPDAPSGHFNLGLALQKQERNSEAETAYRRAVELPIRFPVALPACYCGVSGLISRSYQTVYRPILPSVQSSGPTRQTP